MRKAASHIFGFRPRYLRLLARTGLAALLIFALMLGTSGTVLCIGADGHVALEGLHTSGHGSAHSDSARQRGENAKRAIAGDQAVPCIDIAQASAASGQAGKFAKHLATASHPLPVAVKPAGRAMAERRLPPLTAPPSPHLASLRTTILLI